MRLFVGIPLTAVVIEELSAISMRLQSQADGLRWSAPESWHITLQFLGNTQQYECIVSRLRELRLPPFPIQLDGLGFFERAGVFFAGVNLTSELEALQQHITLARSKGKGGRGLRDLKSKIHRDPRFSGFIADAFVLYESVPGRGGSQYEIRDRFTLGS
jgi:RNA 2',3'-cyclic 3'-phosphodiesterase